MRESSVIVLDLGSQWVRAGHGGQTLPEHQIRSLVGVTERGEKRVADRALFSSEPCRLIRPVSARAAWDRENVAVLLEHLFYEEMALPGPPDSVVVVRPRTMSPGCRGLLAGLLFDQIKARRIAFVDETVAMFNAVNRSTALIVRLGNESIEVYPVYHGYQLLEDLERLEIGGLDVTRQLAESLPVEGDAAARLELAEASKLNAAQLEDPGQLLFQPPEGCGPALPVLIQRAIQKCPMDVRQDLWRNIVLLGGVATTKGLEARLRQELGRLAPEAMQVRVLRPFKGDAFSWHGAALVQSLDTFNDWITKPPN